MASPLSSVDRDLIATLERAFVHHAGGQEHLELADLQRALGLRSQYLARRVLRLLDANGDGRVSREEFLAGVRALVAGTDREKLTFAFRLHDDNDDGYLDPEELVRMIAISLSEHGIPERGAQTAEALAGALLAAADRDRDGRVSFEEFWHLVSSRPALLASMTRHEAIWIAPNEELLVLLDGRAAQQNPARPSRQRYALVLPSVVLALVFAANLSVFAGAWLSHGSDRPPMPLFALAGAAFARCADLDGALILVPMLRRTLSWLRARWVGRVLPLDDAIEFHRAVGHLLFAVAVLHVGASLVSFTQGHDDPLSLFHMPRALTGLGLLAVFAVMWLFALPFVRRQSRFELFYFSHLLYVVWLGLAIAHAPHFLFWAGVPLAGFVIEQALRLVRRAPRTRVVSSRALRSGVTRLELERPAGFAFRAADYGFLCLPEVARHEWHPFTISSAPERDHLVFHVRSLGDWTRALWKQADQSPDAPGLVAYIDGPYGAPSTHIFQSRHAVLIGAGIGVTPFASVLESLLVRAEKGAGPVPEKVHFFWLSRDHVAFEWFADLLAELERRDTRGLFDLHLFVTGLRTGATAMGLEIARSLVESSGGVDLLTGLRAHTHTGPPDWDAELTKIAALHPAGPVDVYFCGPIELEARLRPVCDKHGMSFRAERFLS